MHMLSARDVVVPSEDWELFAESDESVQWRIADGLAVNVLRLKGPSPIPVDAAEATALYTAESAYNGGLPIEVEVIETRAGQVLRSIFKYPIPNRPHGIMIVGIGLLAWEDVHVRVHVEAVELGTTGTREALVFALEPEGFPIRNEQPIKVDSAEDLFEKMAESHRQASANPSDDPKWDDKFPHHPLTRVRAHQQQILSAISVNGMSPCG